MVVMNYTGEEINAKIVYYGPGLSGKTTNLEYLYSQMPINLKGKMVSMKTRTDRTLFFDFFPLELGEICGYQTRFLLYTVPGQVYYNATRKLVLKSADAVVFVADSSRKKLEENIESLRNLEDNLNEQSMSLDDIPWAIQYNKRDVPDAMPIEQLRQHLNLMNVPEFEAVAKDGRGVYETFRGIAGILYNQLKKRLESGEQFATGAQDGQGAVPGPQSGPGPGGGRRPDVNRTVDSALREVETPPPQRTAARHPAPPATEKAPRTPAPQIPTPPTPATGPGGTVPTRRSYSLYAQPPARPQQPDPERAPRPARAPVAPPSAAREAPRRPVRQEPERAREEQDPRLGTQGSDDESFRYDASTEAVVSPEVGRLVELDDVADVSAAHEPEARSEFITDPMRGTTAPAAEPAIEAAEPPSVVDRRADAREEHEVTVPVVISRSQVRKSIPLKLILEIRVVDD